MEAKLQAAFAEIEKLKEENKELEKENKRLEKENKELKNRVNELEQRMDSIEEDDDDEEEVYPEAKNEDEAKWLPLKVDDVYEIFNKYPYQIRKKSNGRIVKESVNKHSGYIQVGLKGKTYQKHILVAKHFIPNPNHLSIVDHKDHDRTNYHVTNLRLVSQKDNCRNRSAYKGIQYEYVDEIPIDAIVVDEYGDHTFTNYYFFDNVFYFDTGINYRKLHINEDRYGNKKVSMIDNDGKNVSVCYNKFKKEYDIFD